MPQIMLTSAQEAALNAAGEAMLELSGHRFYLGRSHHDGEEKRFSVWANVPNMDTVWGLGPSPAEAARDFFRQVEEWEAKPPELRTAKEAVEAVKGIVEEYRAGEGNHVLLDEVADRIAALPVKQ